MPDMRYLRCRGLHDLHSTAAFTAKSSDTCSLSQYRSTLTKRGLRRSDDPKPKGAHRAMRQKLQVAVLTPGYTFYSASCQNTEGSSNLRRLPPEQGLCFHLFRNTTMDQLKVGIRPNLLLAIMVCNCILRLRPYANILDLQDPLGA